MAKRILVANWKNHPSSPREVRDILSGLSRKAKIYKKHSFFIAPPLPYLETVSSRVKSLGYLASQDISLIEAGTHTGQVTPDILKGIGVKLSIIGHSELRALGETDKIVSDKVRMAFRSGIIPLVCVGERVRDTEGEHFSFLREQIKSSLEGVRRKEDITRLVIAYEPVWAIGKKAKEALDPSDLPQMTIFIKKVLTDMFGREMAEKIPLLYGGSVEESNAAALMETRSIRGFLVGHASIDPKRLNLIAEAL